MHVGVLRDGTRVAVKVQYPDVRWKFEVDLRCIANAISIGAKLGMIDREGVSVHCCC